MGNSTVCPIPKTDNLTSIKDYRPILVLSVLSKVHERVILNQLYSFIETKSLYNIIESVSQVFLKGIQPARYYSK